MEGSKTLFCSSKFPWELERISSKFIDNLGYAPSKGFARSVPGRWVSTRADFKARAKKKSPPTMRI